jgi:hypothetical protein
MFAVVVREAGDARQIGASGRQVEENVLPRVRQAPGFVSAIFMTDGAGHTLNVLVFESEEAARRALDAVRAAPRPPSLRLEVAELHEVLASS